MFVLSVALAGTIIYEILLFGYLIKGADKIIAFSVFFTYVFSLAGAAPLVFLLLWSEREVRRYGDVSVVFCYDSITKAFANIHSKYLFKMEIPIPIRLL